VLLDGLLNACNAYLPSQEPLARSALAVARVSIGRFRLDASPDEHGLGAAKRRFFLAPIAVAHNVTSPPSGTSPLRQPPPTSELAAILR